MIKNTKLSLIGVPLDLGAENLGVDLGPNAFRYEGIIDKLKNTHFQVNDLGNISTYPREQLSVGDPLVKYLDEIVRVAKETARTVESVIKRKEKIVVIGGDHSISLGTISGASAAVSKDLGLIYFDAHGDMNTDKTTLTGNIHGMHLAALLGFGKDELIGCYGTAPIIDKKNLLHIGANDLDEAEKEFIHRENLDCFKIIDVLASGIGPLLKRIDILSQRVKNIWVSLDLDVIDAIYAPGAGMPNKGGLSYREITTLVEYIGKRSNVIGMDVVEYNPLLDVEGKTAELGIELIAKALGGNYSWYTNYLQKNKLKP